MGEFKVGLLSCFSNLSLCCFANCLTPLTVGRIVESLGEDHPILWAMAYGLSPCCAGGLIRTKVREKEGIPGGFNGDCCVACLFGPCVLNQIAVQTGVLEPILPKEQEITRVGAE